MDTYLVPLTSPDLDTAERDASSLVDALRLAGVHGEGQLPPGMVLLGEPTAI